MTREFLERLAQTPDMAEEPGGYNNVWLSNPAYLPEVAMAVMSV